jgi:divalent metal cation (Fe/Co/Zn/Cd) transporter
MNLPNPDILVFSKGCLFFYCFFLRRYPAARIFMVTALELLAEQTDRLQIDHRNDIAVNIFGLTMSIVGSRYNVVWYLDPVGAICIALLILYSWASNAFEHMWYLVGKSAPQDFLNKLVYVSVTHSSKIQKIETVSGVPALRIEMLILDRHAHTMQATSIMSRSISSWTKMSLSR